MALHGRTGGRATNTVTIKPYTAIGPIVQASARQQINDIFFEASSVQTFRDDEHKSAFQWLWLERYLAQESEHAFVAATGDSLCGYLVGSLDDPALRPEFAELEYFSQLKAQTKRYPAHLHINIAADMRGRGIGEQLIKAFEAHAADMACPGVHIVTGAGMRNVTFYTRLGYYEVGCVPRNGSEVVMLAKSLG